MIEIIITDDHQLVLDGLTHMLKPFKDIEIIDTVVNGKSLLASLQKNHPTCYCWILIYRILVELNYA